LATTGVSIDIRICCGDTYRRLQVTSQFSKAKALETGIAKIRAVRIIIAMLSNNGNIE